jgi:hypothetical protein
VPGWRAGRDGAAAQRHDIDRAGEMEAAKAKAAMDRDKLMRRSLQRWSAAILDTGSGIEQKCSSRCYRFCNSFALWENLLCL